MQTHQTMAMKVVRILLLTMVAFIIPKLQAKTIILDFSTENSVDLYGARTNAFNEAQYGFTTMSLTDVINNVMLAINNDFFGYSYASLPTGKELDIDFEVGSIGSGPINGDSDFLYFQLGSVISGETYFGHACLGCALTSPPFENSGAVIGSIFTNNIANLAGLANDDAGLINLIAGTTSHEIGHALSLLHPSGKQLNPGESAYGLMSTGAEPTIMPNGERVLDRAFANTNFDVLVNQLGLRDIPMTGTPVPEPSTLFLFLIAIIMISAKRKTTNNAH